MNEQFLKLKKRIWRDIAIKCALSAAAVSVLTVNAVLLPCLLCGVKLFWAWYLLIAFGGLCLGGGVAFLCFRTNDKKIAVRLDGEFCLNERIQTALLYQNKEGEIIDLQREDTVAALKSTKKLAFCNMALTIVLAALLLVGVCALPVVAVYANPDKAPAAQEPVDPPRDLTDWEWEALDELIDHVKASEKADPNAKSGMVSELEGLRTLLVGGVSESSLQLFVENTASNIRNKVTDANDQSGVSEEQKAGNNEECDYVVNKLYEIFSLQQPVDPEPPVDPNPPDPGKDPSEPPNPGTGDLEIDGVPFFDPDKGYVSSGDPEVREKYYSEILKAMLEGTISREEWEEIVATYFADLKDKEENKEV